MNGSLASVLDCMRHQHDPRLLSAAAAVCAVGIYASFALASHAARATGRAWKNRGLVSVVASGCAAWATHFIVLLAFRPGMPAAFEPFLTAVSLACAIIGIGTGVLVALGSRDWQPRFGAGLIVGVGIAALQYVG